MVETEGRVYIELPVEKEFARLLRLLVSGIAARMNFDLDAVEDLKIAVEEAFLLAMQQDLQGPLKISFDLGEKQLEINFNGPTSGVSGLKKPKDSFGNFILEAVVDEMRNNGSENSFDLSLVKNV